MGLLEVEFSPVVKKIMLEPPEKIESFIRNLILIIEKQDTVMAYVEWSENSKVVATKSRDELIEFLRSFK